jgi:hypothetical protein
MGHTVCWDLGCDGGDNTLKMKTTWGKANRRSFDCGSRGEAARSFAQDDTFVVRFEIGGWLYSIVS